MGYKGYIYIYIYIYIYYTWVLFSVDFETTDRTCGFCCESTLIVFVSLAVLSHWVN